MTAFGDASTSGTSKAVLEAAIASSPRAAANFGRRCSRAMRQSGVGYTNFFAERDCLGRWFRSTLISNYCRRFRPVSSGAEHLVFYDIEQHRAIKATRRNRYGHSVRAEGAEASPLEYLRRLAMHNLLFGDDIKLLGCIDTEGSFEIVTSQPWITGHPTLPAATEQNIDAYFSGIGFFRSTLFPHGYVYYSPELELVVMDAHPGNVLVSETGQIMPIDVVVGTPGYELQANILQHLGFQPCVPA